MPFMYQPVMPFMCQPLMPIIYQTVMPSMYQALMPFMHQPLMPHLCVSPMMPALQQAQLISQTFHHHMPYMRLKLSITKTVQFWPSPSTGSTLTNTALPVNSCKTLAYGNCIADLGELSACLGHCQQRHHPGATVATSQPPLYWYPFPATPAGAARDRSHIPCCYW